MATARFSIGIDLGTTNSAMAFVPLEGTAASEVFRVPQWESVGGLTEHVRDGVNGRLLSTDTPRSEFAEALVELSRLDAGSFASMQAAACDTAVAFSAELAQ